MFNIDVSGVEHLGDDDGLGAASLAFERPDVTENNPNIDTVSAFARLADVDLGCEKKCVCLADFC